MENLQYEKKVKFKVSIAIFCILISPVVEIFFGKISQSLLVRPGRPPILGSDFIFMILALLHWGGICYICYIAIDLLLRISNKISDGNEQ